VRHRVEPRLAERRRFVLLPGVHRRGAVDYVGDAAPRQDDLLKRGIVENAGDVEVEVLLVSFDRGFERVVELVGEVGWRRVREVAEAFEVGFEVGEAVIVLAAMAAGEVTKGIPRASERGVGGEEGGDVGKKSS